MEIKATPTERGRVSFEFAFNGEVFHRCSRDIPPGHTGHWVLTFKDIKAVYNAYMASIRELRRESRYIANWECIPPALNRSAIGYVNSLDPETALAKMRRAWAKMVEGAEAVALSRRAWAVFLPGGEGWVSVNLFQFKPCFSPVRVSAWLVENSARKSLPLEVYVALGAAYPSKPLNHTWAVHFHTLYSVALVRARVNLTGGEGLVVFRVSRGVVWHQPVLLKRLTWCNDWKEVYKEWAVKVVALGGKGETLAVKPYKPKAGQETLTVTRKRLARVSIPP